MSSPIRTLCDHLHKRTALPFDWVVEYMGDGTIRAAWDHEADVSWDHETDVSNPYVGGMLQILMALRLKRPRVRDHRLRDATGAVLIAWARADMSPTFVELFVPLVAESIRPHKFEWYIGKLAEIYRTTREIPARDLANYLHFMAASARELRSNGYYMVERIPMVRTHSSSASGLWSTYARAIAAAVPAPSAAEVMALFEPSAP